MTHTVEKNQETEWTWKQKLMYGLVYIVGLLVLVAVGWYVYQSYATKQYTPTAFSFNVPESISIPIKKRK